MPERVRTADLWIRSPKAFHPIERPSGRPAARALPVWIWTLVRRLVGLGMIGSYGRGRFSLSLGGWSWPFGYID